MTMLWQTYRAARAVDLLASQMSFALLEDVTAAVAKRAKSNLTGSIKYYFNTKLQNADQLIGIS